MSKVARARVKLRRWKDKQQDKKLRKLKLKTNQALRKAKRNEAIVKAREKVAKAEARASAAERRRNTARIKKGEQKMKKIKKFGKQVLRGLTR